MHNRSWWRGERGEWYVIVQVGLFGLVALGPRTLPGLLAWSEPLNGIGRFLGVVLVLAGAILALSGLLWLGTNLSPLPHPKEDAQFVESGPYRLVRHPIYSGIVMAAFGWGGLNASTMTLLYALILLLFFDFKTRREERWLARKFSAYAGYQSRVRKLIPFLY